MSVAPAFFVFLPRGLLLYAARPQKSTEKKKKQIPFFRSAAGAACFW
jgi:hypothetical protein